MEIRNTQGKVIGNLENGVLSKRVLKSKHFHRVLNSWGMDERIFTNDFDSVRIYDKENKVTYVAPKSLWLTKGIKKNFGYGQQIFLPITNFQIENEKQRKLV